MCVGFLAHTTLARAESGDYLSRRDTVSLSAGNATRANIAIQTPTPWPPYVNDVNIPGSGHRAVRAIENLYKPAAGARTSAPATPADLLGPSSQ